MKYQQLILGVCCGLIVGFLIGNYSSTDKFVIISDKDATEIKLNKRTGDTWILNGGAWRPLTTTKTFVYHTPD